MPRPNEMRTGYFLPFFFAEGVNTHIHIFTGYLLAVPATPSIQKTNLDLPRPAVEQPPPEISSRTGESSPAVVAAGPVADTSSQSAGPVGRSYRRLEATWPGEFDLDSSNDDK